MDTAAKLSAFIGNSAERHAAATVAQAEDPSGGHEAELRRSRRLLSAGTKVALGHAPLSALTSYRQANGCGEPLLTMGEISRARAHGALRHHPATPWACPPVARCSGRWSHLPHASEANSEPAAAAEGVRVGRCEISHGCTLLSPPALGCAPGAPRLCPQRMWARVVPPRHALQRLLRQRMCVWQ
jgi:hypothetical protein